MTKKNKALATDELKDFKIEIDPFGQIVRSRPVEDLNAFLNENVEDLKLKDRPDFEPQNKKK